MENDLEDTPIKVKFLRSFQTARASKQQLQNIIHSDAFSTILVSLE